MKTLAFYSFKGGVGRSLSLANLAYVLSKEYGMRVGLIDLDVESSGLHHICRIKVPEGKDLLNLLLPKNRELTKLTDFIQPVPHFGIKDRPSVYLLPTLSNVTVLQQIQWDRTVELFIRKEVLPAFKNIYELDYLLIDGRTGLSRFSALAIMEAQLVLLFSRLDRQSEFGTSRMVKVCSEAGKSFAVVVSGCPQVRGYQSRLKEFEKEIDSTVTSVLPYLADLYFEEFVVSDRFPRTALARAYAGLAKMIVEHDDEDL